MIDGGHCARSPRGREGRTEEERRRQQWALVVVKLEHCVLSCPNKRGQRLRELKRHSRNLQPRFFGTAEYSSPHAARYNTHLVLRSDGLPKRLPPVTDLFAKIVFGSFYFFSPFLCKHNAINGNVLLVGDRTDRERERVS